MNTVVITIISIIAGAVTSFLIAKWQMRRNSIIHFTLNTYDIGSGLNKEFPNFKLTYDNNELSNSVRVLTGGFMNNGNKDIPNNPSFDLILPDKCLVKAITITPSDPSIAINQSIDESKKNVVHFHIDDIFKSDEYIEYTVIVETPEDLGDLDDNLKFNHRIVNTEKIKNLFIGSIREHSQTRRLKKRLMIGYIIFISILNCWACLNPSMNIKVYDNLSNEAVAIHVSPKSNLYDGNILWGKKITKEDLANNYHISPVITYNEYMPRVYVYGGITIVITILFLFMMFDFSEKNHVIKVLSKTKIEKKKK